MVPCLTHDVLLDFHMTPGQLEVVVTPSLASVTRLEALKNENQQESRCTGQPTAGNDNVRICGPAFMCEHSTKQLFSQLV
jgi:hypothetical protein